MSGCQRNHFNEILAEALRKQAMTPKPCPFCGNEPRVQRDSRWPRSGPHEGERVDAFEVVCDNYECPIYHADTVYFLSEQDAVDAWNRRADMEMPKACVFCELYEGQTHWCRGAKKEIQYSSEYERADDCPLVPVPPHGRLIEKNAVFELIRSFPNVDRQLPVEFMKALYELPTILEAEEGE